MVEGEGRDLSPEETRTEKEDQLRDTVKAGREFKEDRPDLAFGSVRRAEEIGQQVISARRGSISRDEVLSPAPPEDESVAVEPNDVGVYRRAVQRERALMERMQKLPPEERQTSDGQLLINEFDLAQAETATAWRRLQARQPQEANRLREVILTEENVGKEFDLAPSEEREEAKGAEDEAALQELPGELDRRAAQIVETWDDTEAGKDNLS